MNDPGLDQPIQHAESQANEAVVAPRHEGLNRTETKAKEEEEQKEEERYLTPTKWWYAVSLPSPPVACCEKESNRYT